MSDLEGVQKARKTEMESSIPSWLPVPASELDEKYTLAAWNPDEINHDGSRGCVLINREHPGVLGLVEEMARSYSVGRDQVALWGQVEETVLETLGQSLVAKVVHVQSTLRAHVDVTTLRTTYLSDAALTTAGLGMVAEQQVAATVLGGKLGRKKSA